MKKAEQRKEAEWLIDYYFQQLFKRGCVDFYQGLLCGDFLGAIFSFQITGIISAQEYDFLLKAEKTASRI